MCSIYLILALSSITQNYKGPVTFAMDVFGIATGSLLQIWTKPDSWWGALDQDQCNIVSSPVAVQFFFLGEVLTFSSFFRIILLVYKMEQVSLWMKIVALFLILTNVVIFSFVTEAVTNSIRQNT